MADGSDLPAPGRAAAGVSTVLSGAELVQQVSTAVDKGSTRGSPFMHFSREFKEARHWWTRGKMSRDEKKGYICRVDIAELEDLAALSQGIRDQETRKGVHPVAALGSIIDVSSPAAAQKYFGQKWCDSELVSDQSFKLSIAHAQKEVLVAWRGEVPASMFEVVDENTGEGKHRLVAADQAW